MVLLVQYYEEMGKPTPKAEVIRFLKDRQYTDAKDFAGECEPVVVIAKGQSMVSFSPIISSSIMPIWLIYVYPIPFSLMFTSLGKILLRPATRVYVAYIMMFKWVRVRIPKTYRWPIYYWVKIFKHGHNSFFLVIRETYRSNIRMKDKEK